MNEGFNNLWPTIILKDVITDKLLLDDITNYTLLKYGQDNKVSADIKDENLFDDDYYKKFKNNIVIPSFEKYLQKNVGINLKDKQL